MFFLLQWLFIDQNKRQSSRHKSCSVDKIAWVLITVTDAKRNLPTEASKNSLATAKHWQFSTLNWMSWWLSDSIDVYIICQQWQEHGTQPVFLRVLTFVNITKTANRKRENGNCFGLDDGSIAFVIVPSIISWFPGRTEENSSFDLLPDES